MEQLDIQRKAATKPQWNSMSPRVTAVIFSVRAEVDPISPCESETRLKAGAGAVPLRRHRLVGRNRANPS
jgi:hypothetical protein